MILEKIRILTQLQTLAWTLPMLALCFAVLWEIRKSTYSACFKDSNEKKSQMCWILCGIFFAFVGKMVETAWWAIPWTLDYLKHPAWAEFNSYGVYINAVFRQGLFTIAAYCHLRAFIAPQKEEKGIKAINWILGISLLLGQAYIVILLLIKPMS